MTALLQQAADAARTILGGNGTPEQWQTVLKCMREVGIEADLVREMLHLLVTNTWHGKTDPAGWLRATVIRSARQQRMRQLRRRRREIPVEEHHVVARD